MLMHRRRAATTAAAPWKPPATATATSQPLQQPPLHCNWLQNYRMVVVGRQQQCYHRGMATTVRTAVRAVNIEVNKEEEPRSLNLSTILASSSGSRVLLYWRESSVVVVVSSIHSWLQNKTMVYCSSTELSTASVRELCISTCKY